VALLITAGLVLVLVTDEVSAFNDAFMWIRLPAS
jgi:hypothetical protein